MLIKSATQAFRHGSAAPVDVRVTIATVFEDSGG
jgi:hypothetical protein